MIRLLSLANRQEMDFDDKPKWKQRNPGGKQTGCTDPVPSRGTAVVSSVELSRANSLGLRGLTFRPDLPTLSERLGSSLGKLPEVGAGWRETLA